MAKPEEFSHAVMEALEEAFINNHGQQLILLNIRGANVMDKVPGFVVLMGSIQIIRGSKDPTPGIPYAKVVWNTAPPSPGGFESWPPKGKS